MLNQIYNYLNKSSEKSKPEKQKTEKSKVELLEKEESDKIMERLIEKVSKKIGDENEALNEMAMVNSGLMKTKVFQNLINRNDNHSPISSVKSTIFNIGY